MLVFRNRLKLTAVLAGALVVGALSAPGSAAGAQEPSDAVVIDSDWVVAHGSDIVEETAAYQLAGELAEKYGVSVGVHPTGTIPDATGWLRRRNIDASGVIIIGTPDDNALTELSHRRSRFDLPAGEPEAYHLSERTAANGLQLLYITGASPKGAMNGVFRLQQQFLSADGLDVTGLDDAASPAFVNRVGGHKFTQAPPPDWTEDEQAEYYAANYINVVWGEKYGPPLSRETREKWGLTLALEVPLPPADRAWLDDPANASAVYWRDTPSGQRRVVSPFDEVGRQAYLDAFTEALEENPDTAILSTVFGDYSYATDENSTRVSDGAPCDCTKESSALEIMEILAEAVENHPATPAAWLWHLFPDGGDEAFMQQLEDMGVGMIYNEAGNADNWITKRTNFNATALATDDSGRTRWGPDYHMLVSAGGSDESVKPAIGMPLPHMTASKIHALADIGVQNFYLWWGSAEGWTYSANMSVIREMIWEPDLFDPANAHPFNSDSPEPLMQRVAESDFGELAPDVLRYWGAIDHALVNPAPDGSDAGLPIYSWYQRLAIYLNPRVFGGGAAVRPLTPAGLKSTEFSAYRPWATQQSTIDAFGRVAEDLAAANALGAQFDDGSSARLTQMRQWTEIYTHVFTSRLHFLKGLRVADEYTDVDDPAFRNALEPITAAQIATTQAMEAALSALPANATFFSGSRLIFNGNVDRDQDLGIMRAKLLSMQAWWDGLANVALGKTATASSTPDSTQSPDRAVDGDWSTRWRSDGRSAGSDSEWLAVDLGSPIATEAVVVRWNPDNAADHYQIQIADSAGGPWTTVADVTQPSGRDDAIVLPAETKAEHIRVVGRDRANFNFSVRELEVYALGSSGEMTGTDGRCVGVEGGANTSPVQLTECDGTPGQQWTIPGDGTIRTLGKCMDVRHAGTGNGSRVWLWDCNGGGAQQWRWRPSDQGLPGGTLVNPRSDRCLDAEITEASTPAPLRLWDCDGRDGQRWKLPPAEPPLEPEVRLADPATARLVQAGTSRQFTVEIAGLAEGIEGTVTVEVPDGWPVDGATQQFVVTEGRAARVDVELTIPAGAGAGRHEIGLRAETGDLEATASPSLTVVDEWIPLDLSSLLNLDVVSSHDDYSDGDFDSFGTSYPVEELPAPGAVELLGVPFDFPDTTVDGENNVVASEGQTLSLPAGHYSSAVFLGAARGATAGELTVHYADGTTSDIPFRIPAWGAAAELEPDDEIALETTHRHHPDGGEICCSSRIYAEIVELDPGRELVSITLPDNDRLRVFATTLATAEPGTGPTPGELCDPFAQQQVGDGRYIVQNNVWGAATDQCVSVDGTSFTVTLAEHNKATGGPPASYPSIYTGCHFGNCSPASSLPIQVSALSSVTSSWAATTPDDGSYNVAYDLWFDPDPQQDGQNAAELMIWLDRHGSIQPAGSPVDTVTIDGATYEVWTDDTEWNVISYLRTEPTDSVDGLDLKAFADDAVRRGSVEEGWYLTSVQAGFEIWQGGADLASQSFSVVAEHGG